MKAAAEMTKEQLVEFIRFKRDTEKLDWPKIKRAVDESGYRSSKRAGQKLSANTIRILYYKGASTAKGPAFAEAEKRIGMIEALSEMSLSDRQFREMVMQLLKKD